MKRQTHRGDERPPDDADLAAATELRAPPLCPEIRLALVPTSTSLDAFRAANKSLLGAAPPYWAVAWPGGQALARHLLDRPDIVRGRRVVDLGTGSGLAAIAAAMADAAHVTAVDRDPAAIAATRRNARLNGVPVEVRQDDIAAPDSIDAEIVLAGDLWYEPFDGRRATTVLRHLARRGATVLIGDPGRSHLPRAGIDWLATYTVQADEALEAAAHVESRVGRLRDAPGGPCDERGGPAREDRDTGGRAGPFG